MFTWMTFMTALTAANPTPTFLTEYAQTRKYMAGRPEMPVVTPDSSAVLFLRSGPKDARQTLFELTVATGTTREILTPEALLKGAAETLSVAERAALERRRSSARGFGAFELSADGASVLVTLSGKPYVLERATGKVVALHSGEGTCLGAKFSPDARLVGYVRANDVYVVELAKNVEHAVTTGGTELKPHGLAEFVAQEEMSRFEGFWFSADSKQVVFQTTDHTGVEQMAISDPIHPEAEPNRFFYPRAGQRNVTVTLSLVSVAGGKVTPISWQADPYSYVATVRWPKAGRLTVLVQNRPQTKTQLLAVDPKTGATTVLLSEEDAAWVRTVQEVPNWLPDGSGFFWFTEKNGGPEIELRNADGSYRSTWVKPEAGLVEKKGVVAYDAERKALYVVASSDPTQSVLSRAREGGALERVTVKDPSATGPGNTFAKVSERFDLALVTTGSLRSMPKTHVVRTSDGSVVCEVPSVAIEPSVTLSTEIVQLEGGIKPWAQIIRPSNFVKGQKYPVVLNVYGGPGHQEILHTLGINLPLQWLANEGFVVVKLDGRGTPGRGRDWERVISHDFATVISDDQLAGLKGLAAKYRELDLTRVGAYGWSFGGYLSALLALKHGEVVKYAVAGAPVVDWLDYDTHYTERYLGVPTPGPEMAKSPAYAVSSLLTYVKDAKGGLLLMHGTADDNVYFSHSLKLSNALFLAGKPHEVLPLANLTHMVPEPLVMQRQWERIAKAFKEHL